MLSQQTAEKKSYRKPQKMSLVSQYIFLALASQTLVSAQDTYGNPESPLLRPSSNLRFRPTNFQTLLGHTQLAAGSSARFTSSETAFQGINDLVIEDFSPIASSSDEITQSTFSQSTLTPPTPTLSSVTPPQRIPSNSLQNSISRQTSSRIPPLPASQPRSDTITGGIDFSNAQRTADGRLCVIKEESVQTVSKDPILACTHKNLEKCHYTYVTYFKAAQEEVCEENFEKKCQITFKQEAIKETVRKCYRPQEKVCNGQGKEECRTVYESSCTTKYVEKTPGKFVGDTACEKLPVKICGRGCVTREGAEECHNKEIDSLVDIPEEVCDLNPQKTCRLQTKLVPSLKPKQECTTVPQETCILNFSQPKREEKPLRTEWCLDEETSPSNQQSQYRSN